MAPLRLLPRLSIHRRLGEGLCRGPGPVGTAGAAVVEPPGLSRAGLSNLKAIKAIISARSGLAPGCREAATTDHVLDAAGPRTRLSPTPAPTHTLTRTEPAPARGRTGQGRVRGHGEGHTAFTADSHSLSVHLVQGSAAQGLSRRIWPSALAIAAITMCLLEHGDDSDV